MAYDDVVGHVGQSIEGVGAAIMTLGGAWVLRHYARALQSGRIDDADSRRLRSWHQDGSALFVRRLERRPARG